MNHAQIISTETSVPNTIMKLYLLAVLLSFAVSVNTSALPKEEISSSGKLLYILLDGFRYDYVDDLESSELPGFTELISNGVKARWVNPLYPTLSYPSWTTLATGLYAESHNIVGNYFYDSKDETVFYLFNNTSTGKSKWWTTEPLWTTATKAGKRTSLYLWSRCDVPFDGVLPEQCQRFEKITGPEIFRTNIDNALKDFENGFDLVQVYTEHLDNIGHTIGPETEARRNATKEIDETLVYLQEKLRDMSMDGEVNIVIVSDHGMASTAPGTINRLELDDYLPANSVENIADKGAYINIKVLPGHLDEVYESLGNMSGVTVYTREDVPEHFHLTGSEYVHDLLLFADIGTFVMASNSSEQLPPRSSFVYNGAHGYMPSEEKMRSIFYAKGPAFASGTTLEPINIVDIYQVLTNTLNITPQPNNGTWDNVRGAFRAAASHDAPAAKTVFSVMLVLMAAWNSFSL